VGDRVTVSFTGPVWSPRKGRLTRPWALGAEFVRLSLLGTLQYIPCSLVVTAASVVGTLQGAYHEGRFRFDDVYLYAIIVGSYRSGGREHSRARCNRGAREGNRALKRAGHPFSFVLIS
jgi:hypothetical protein